MVIKHLNYPFPIWRVPISQLIRFGGINSVLSFKFGPYIEAHKHPCPEKKINGFKRFSHSHVFIHYEGRIYTFHLLRINWREEKREKKFNATIELCLNLLCRFVLAIRCVFSPLSLSFHLQPLNFLVSILIHLAFAVPIFFSICDSCLSHYFHVHATICETVCICACVYIFAFSLWCVYLDPYTHALCMYEWYTFICTNICYANMFGPSKK